jgi:peptidoglycan hydrolase-like protein with peptidoglycan-binding domain
MRKYFFVILAVCVSVPLSASAATCTFKRDLEIKSRGSDVSCLQQILAKGGFLDSEPTGYFGGLTEKALKAWQKDRGVKASGYFGALSRKAYGLRIAAVVSNEHSAVRAQVQEVPVTYSSTVGIYANNSVSPIVSAGAIKQRLASFLVAAPVNQSLRISSLTFDRDANPNINFKNLKIFINGSQFGATRAALGDVEGKIVFSISSPFVIAAGSTAIIEVFADTLSNSVIGTYYSVIDLVGWGAIGGGSLSTIFFPGVVEGQAVSVTASGDIYNIVPSLASTIGVSPIMAAGSLNQRIASFMITAPASQLIRLSLLTFDKDYNAGLDLQNIKVLINGVQFGAVRPNVGDAEGNLTFSGSIVTISAGSTVIIDVYADAVSTSSSGSHISVIDLTGWAATTGSGTVLQFPAVIEGQPVTIIQTGTVSLSLGSSAATGYVVMGSMASELATFRFAADGVDDLRVAEVVIRDSISGGATGVSSFKNLTLWDGATKIAGPVTMIMTAADAGAISFVVSGNGILIARNNTKDLILKGDVAALNSGGATANSQHQFTIASAQDVTVRSATTPSAHVVVSGAPVVANPITISASGAALTISRGAHSPSGTSFSMGTVHNSLTDFLLTADGSDDLRLTDLIVTDTITSGSTGVPSFVNLTLWDDQVQVGGPLPMTVSGIGGPVGTVHFTLSGSGLTITRNSSKTLRLKADVASLASGGSVAGSTHIFKIAANSDVAVRAVSAPTATVTISGAPVSGNGMTVVFQQ